MYILFIEFGFFYMRDVLRREKKGAGLQRVVRKLGE
jgi:hypothetical protein